MLSRYQNAAAASREYAERFQKDTILGHVSYRGEIDRTEVNILENNKNIQSIISVNTNILLRRFRLKFLRIMYSTSCYKERLNFENSLYISYFFEIKINTYNGTSFAKISSI
jgi:hypothetical protein